MIAANFWRQLFPERQIYLRSQGRVRGVSLSPGAQFTGAAIFLLIFSWMTFASVNFAFHHGALVGRDAQFNALRTSNERLLAEIVQVQQRFLNTTMELEAKKRQLAELLAQNNRADTDIAVLAENQDVATVKSGNPGVLPRPRPEALRDETPEVLRRETNISSDVLPRMRPVRPVFTLPSNMTAIDGGLPDNDRATSMGPGLTGAKSAQYDVMAYLAADAHTAVAALEKLINQTGLDADTMLRRRDEAAKPDTHAEGGPLLSLPPSMTAKFLRRNMPRELAMPSTRKGRLEMLREALFSLPLAEPVDKYYVSSAYGYRRDPFTHARAFHSGMDLVAPHGDPVLSSAPGTVIFAGPNGPYGNMVEIDHGRGVKSRYGHLSKITVTRGQKIGLRDLIGRVGNTGRSGTAHLHFEVWFDGKARDPRNFLKAGENVFQRQG
jgi:murein DD-endopeptidase MepM/ murein hydrolase activator NlpD